jgi:hypothetical protein
MLLIPATTRPLLPGTLTALDSTHHSGRHPQQLLPLDLGLHGHNQPTRHRHATRVQLREIIPEQGHEGQVTEAMGPQANNAEPLGRVENLAFVRIV